MKEPLKTAPTDYVCELRARCAQIEQRRKRANRIVGMISLSAVVIFCGLLGVGTSRIMRKIENSRQAAKAKSVTNLTFTLVWPTNVLVMTNAWIQLSPIRPLTPWEQFCRSLKKGEMAL